MASRCLACRQELPNHAPDCTIKNRLAQREPNLQNIPIRTEEGAKIRKIFANHRYRKD